MPVEIFQDRIWQMSLGERAAVEGVLSQLAPALAIEIGSAEGSCLQRIAAHSQQVHSFDLTGPALPMPDNVTLHTGDSHELLPRFLAGLSEQGRNVDFVMVDGDHSPEGVRRDLEDLLDSRAVARTVILIHDTTNPRVRSGVDAVRFAAWPKVAHVELDWVPGRLFAEPALRNELWYGVGLVLVDSTRPAYLNGDVYEQRYYPSAPLMGEIQELVAARELAPSAIDPAAENADLRRRVVALTAELSRERMRIAPAAMTPPAVPSRAATPAGARARAILGRVEAQPGGEAVVAVLRRGARAPAGRAARRVVYEARQSGRGLARRLIRARRPGA